MTFRDPLADHPLSVLARQITDEIIAPVELEVGRRYQHPRAGTIQITGGCYRDPVHGRVSNFWHWIELTDGRPGCGYGARWPAA